MGRKIKNPGIVMRADIEKNFGPIETRDQAKVLVDTDKCFAMKVSSNNSLYSGGTGRIMGLQISEKIQKKGPEAVIGFIFDAFTAAFKTKKTPDPKNIEISGRIARIYD